MRDTVIDARAGWRRRPPAKISSNQIGAASAAVVLALRATGIPIASALGLMSTPHVLCMMLAIFIFCLAPGLVTGLPNLVMGPLL